MKKINIHLIKILSFIIGIIVFLFLCSNNFSNQNPIKLYLLSYQCMLTAFCLVIRNPLSLIFLIVPLITIILEILSLRKNKPLFNILTCLFFFLFNLNQYFLLVNIAGS